MQCLEAVIVNAIKAVEGERTSSSVYHLLKGKKSAQTIQDAHLYQLTKWFQTAPFLTVPLFEAILKQLIANAHLTGELHRPFVTREGLLEMNRAFSRTGSFERLSGWQLAGAAPLFFSRLQLLVQVASQLAYQDSSYYPVTRDEQLHEWVKRFLKQIPYPKKEVSSRLHVELSDLFEQLPEKPECILIRFSGYKQTGKTLAQSAEWLEMEQTEYWFRFLHALHAMVSQVNEAPDKAPILQRLIADIYNPLPLTESARQTADFLKRGLTLEEVAARRNLKRATIEDHVVELALNDPAFSIRPFIDEQKQSAVRKLAADLSNRQLKPLKEKLPDHSYFQIRLVLAKESRNRV